MSNHLSACQLWADSITGITTDNTTWIGDSVYDYNDHTYYPGRVTIYPYAPSYTTQELDINIKLKEEKTKEEDLMKVFEITVIDRRECEILHEQKVIAKDKETAMLELNLTPEMKKLVRKNLIEFIFNEIGTFTKAQRKIKVKDLVEEED